MLAEPRLAAKHAAMPPVSVRRAVALTLAAMLAFGASACRDEPEGTVKAIVIGPTPKLRDPAMAPLSAPDALLVASVAQGLVQFDARGNIIAGLAERWNVSDDGLSYIFRLAAGEWPGGRKISAHQVARILRREIGPGSKNPVKDTLGAVDEIV